MAPSPDKAGTLLVVIGVTSGMVAANIAKAGPALIKVRLRLNKDALLLDKAAPSLPIDLRSESGSCSRAGVHEQSDS
jgi:hypothetical protein